MPPPFDAVLVIAFGGPLGPDDVRPFLGNVLRGRRVAPERVDEVAHHYDLFGGVSPITELTRRQAAGLETRLRARGFQLPVYVGMRNWHPYLADTLAEMSQNGVRRAIGVVAAAYRSYSSCTQYRENVEGAREALRRSGSPDVAVTYVSDWHLHSGFIDANVANIDEALASLPADAQGAARIVFTAHSIPMSMADKYPYQEQLRDTASRVADLVGRNFSSAEGADRDWALVYQSRSGRPEDPWLGPDVCDYLREERARGLRAAVLAPIGFICDHIEVLYDLDVEAAETCLQLDLPMARAQAVNDHPRFIDALADAVAETYARYERGRPVPLVSQSTGA
jgi:ferrochelatase